MEDDGNRAEAHRDDIATLAGGAGITFAGKIAGGGIQYLFYIVAARLLGVRQFGLLMLGITVFEFTCLVGRMGMEGAAVRFVSLHASARNRRGIKGTISSVIKHSVLLSAVLGAALFFVPESLYVLLGKPELRKVIRVLALAVPFSSLMVVGLNVTQGFRTMRYTVYVQNLFVPAANLAFFLLLSMLGWSLLAAAAAFDLALFLAACLTLVFIGRMFPDFAKVQAESNDREIRVFALKFLGIMFLMVVMMWTDTLMLGVLKSSEDVGVYSVAARTALLLNTILLSFSHIFSPVISGLFHQRRMERLGALFKTVTKWSFAVGLPVFLFIAISSRQVMGLFGGGFGAGHVVLIILTFVQFVNVGTGPVTHMLIMSGHENVMVTISSAACAVNIALNFLLIPRFGVLGAAAASGVSVILFNLSMLVMTFVFLRMHPYDRSYCTVLLISAPACAILLGVRRLATGLSDLALLVAGAVFFAASYAVLMYKFGLGEEDRLVIDIVKRRMRGK